MLDDFDRVWPKFAQIYPRVAQRWAMSVEFAPDSDNHGRYRPKLARCRPNLAPSRRTSGPQLARSTYIHVHTFRARASGNSAQRLYRPRTAPKTSKIGPKCPARRQGKCCPIFRERLPFRAADGDGLGAASPGRSPAACRARKFRSERSGLEVGPNSGEDVREKAGSGASEPIRGTNVRRNPSPFRKEMSLTALAPAYLEAAPVAPTQRRQSRATLRMALAPIFGPLPGDPRPTSKRVPELGMRLGGSSL